MYLCFWKKYITQVKRWEYIYHFKYLNDEIICEHMIYWSTHEICEGNRTRRNTGTGPRDLELWAKVDHAYDRKCTQQAADQRSHWPASCNILQHKKESVFLHRSVIVDKTEFIIVFLSGIWPDAHHAFSFMRTHHVTQDIKNLVSAWYSLIIANPIWNTRI